MPYIPLGRYGDQEQYIPHLRVERLIGGVINGRQIILAGGTHGVIRSENYEPGSQGWAIFGDGSAEFASLTITVGFDDVGASGTGNTTGLIIAAGGSMKSSNYAAGTDGWIIDGDGSAEFDDVVIRGTITAGIGSDVDWSYISNVVIDNADITSLAVSKITSSGAEGFNTGTILVTSALQSADYVGGSAGWKIDGVGNAEFNDVTVRGVLTTQAGSDVDWAHLSNISVQSADIVSLVASKITAGTLSGFTFVSGTFGGNTIGTTSSPMVAGASGGFQTAADGSARWALLGTPANALRFLDTSNQVNFALTPGSGEMIFDTAFATDTNNDMTFYVDDRFWVSTMNGGASVRLDVRDTFIGMRGDIFLYDGDLEFDTQNNAIRSADGTDVLRINNDGISYENAVTVFPSRVSVSPTDVTTFASTAWITTPTSTITLWTHGGTNRVVEVTAWATATWNEAGANAYTGEIKIQVSVDGGTTWTDSVVAGPAYVGTATGGQGYRAPMACNFHSEFASATGDIQVRLAHKVGNTGMDALRRIHLMAVAEQVF